MKASILIEKFGKEKVTIPALSWSDFLKLLDELSKAKKTKNKDKDKDRV